MSLVKRARHAVAGALAGAFLGAGLVVSPDYSAAQMRVGESRLQALAARYGSQVRRLVENWQKLIADYRDAAEMEMLEAANNFFNQLAFLDDIVL